MGEHTTWERLEGEPNTWYQRFLLYRDMPYGTPPVLRTVFGAANLSQVQKGAKKYTGTPQAWLQASRTWRWEERAAAYDAHLQKEREDLVAIERAKVLTARYALMHKRVELLDRKVQQLAELTDNPDEIWLPDVKSVGSGPTAQRVDLVQFNDAAFRELREYLTDLAAELGERVKKKEISITNLPKVYHGFDPDEDGSEP